MGKVVARWGFAVLILAATVAASVRFTLASLTDTRVVQGEVQAGFWSVEPEGCSHGYWKSHMDRWPSAYEPDDLFSVHFADAFPGMTLLDVLEERGGHLDALGRESVAAVLNAADPDVEYAFTEEEIKAMFDTVFQGADGDYDTLKDQFEAENQKDCPP